MIVVCHSCHARFHLDDRLFRGSKGMRVRCRKCGENIVVMNPKAPSSPPRAEARSVPSPPRSKEPPPETKADVARISPSVPQTKAAPHPQEQKTVTPAAAPAPVRLDTAGSGPEQKRIGKPPEKTAAPRQKSSEPKENLIDDRNVPSRDAAPPEPVMASPQSFVDSTWSEKTEPRQRIHSLISPRPLHKRSIFPIAALLFLLFCGAAAYIGFTWTDKKLLHKFSVGTESMLSGGATAVPHQIIRDVSAYYVPRTASEKLFVLKGMVENRGTIAESGIRIRVTLLNGTSQVVATRTFPAGHIYTDEELRNMDRARIEEGMSIRFGEDPLTMEIPPGKFLPFMALFFDLKESIASYQMTVQRAQ